MPGHDQPILEGGICLSEIEELWSLLQEPDPIPSSCSDTSNSNSNSNSNNQTVTDSSRSEDRKRKRTISNRESARRSRWRKKKHFEELQDELIRLNATNRELSTRLGLMAFQCFAIRRENQRLRLECVSLSATLLNLYEIFVATGAQHQLI